MKRNSLNPHVDVAQSGLAGGKKQRRKSNKCIRQLAFYKWNTEERIRKDMKSAVVKVKIQIEGGISREKEDGQEDLLFLPGRRQACERQVPCVVLLARRQRQARIWCRRR